MSLFDNNPFSNITDLIPGFGNPFGLPSEGLWNLQKGSFKIGFLNEVTFYVENPIGQFPNQYTAVDTINDTAGRRLAIYEYPYVDGAAIQDLGRKPERFVMNIKFFGSNYQILFKDFIETLTRSNQKGTLNHPVRGSFPARFLDWEFVHRYDEWNAVTIKATFIEDQTGTVNHINIFDSLNSLLRQALQLLSSITSAITSALSAAVALKRLPSQILTNLNQQLSAIITQVSNFLGQLAATYSSDAQIKSIFANAVKVGNAIQVNSGVTSTSSANPTGQLPAVFQVGFSPATQTAITSQLSSFVNSNQITPQQALFSANQIRSSISLAISSINEVLDNDGYLAVVQYRILANQIQTVTQAAIANIQTQVKLYTVPFAMSLRMVAFKNGLSYDRQNDIENLNPYVTSVNYIPQGTVLQVPAA